MLCRVATRNKVESCGILRTNRFTEALAVVTNFISRVSFGRGERDCNRKINI